MLYFQYRTDNPPRIDFSIAGGSPFDCQSFGATARYASIRTDNMDKHLTPEERLDRAVSWLRDVLRGCTDIKKQLRTITTVCAKWKVDRVAVRESLKDIIREPRTEEERLFSEDLWLREKVIVPRRSR